MGDFKFEIEEQKKVHLFVDMTNISPPFEKNVPLLMEDPLYNLKNLRFLILGISMTLKNWQKYQETTIFTKLGLIFPELFLNE